MTNGGSGQNVVGAGAALASRQLAGIALGVAADQVAGSAANQGGAWLLLLLLGNVIIAGAWLATRGHNTVKESNPGWREWLTWPVIG